jgi:crotonobetainyl-CoA:carnitine CoA-transferase CaiB-like acyl-CoA transferase
MLDGIRVVELGTTITAPLAAMLLGDLGADVIKVERPAGDPFRSFRGGSYSPHFVAYNRNKRSVVLDLTRADARAVLHELLGETDVFIDNLRPNVLPKMDLDPATLQTRCPRLIHCSITGFGSRGPDRDRPAFDAVAQALSGLTSLSVDPTHPDVTGPTISDNVTGMYAAYGILGALFERERTGNGRRLEINMLEASMSFIGDAFANVTQLGVSLNTHSRVASSQSYAFKCSDGRLVAVHMSSIEKFWTGLLAALNAGDLAGDPRFSSRMARVEHYLVLRDLLAERFALRPATEWAQRLEQADVPYARVNSVADALEEPQLAALQTLFRVEHPTEGPITMIHSPIHAGGERITPRKPAPTLGEHTDAIVASASVRQP